MIKDEKFKKDLTSTQIDRTKPSLKPIYQEYQDKKILSHLLLKRSILANCVPSLPKIYLRLSLQTVAHQTNLNLPPAAKHKIGSPSFALFRAYLLWSSSLILYNREADVGSQNGDCSCETLGSVWHQESGGRKIVWMNFQLMKRGRNRLVCPVVKGIGLGSSVCTWC